MHYDRNIVLCAFRALHPDPLEPTEDRLEKFDGELEKLLDADVRTQAAANGIDVTGSFNLSMLIFFSACSTAKRPETKARHGCTYFLAVNPVP